jgi:hypothetical protein
MQVLRHGRKEGGTIYAIVALTLGFLVFLSLGLFFLARVYGAKNVQNNATEAAALVAARELGRIVLEDPYYGYISLSDYPPSGKLTLAADGEPLPVFGINTLVADARRNCLLARKLDNAEFLALSHLEAQELRRAANALNQHLSVVLSAPKEVKAVDCNGKTVNPYKEAKAAFLANLPGATRGLAAELQGFSLSFGWQDGKVASSVTLPTHENLSELPKDSNIAGQYRAFVDIPCAEESFYFAGLGKRPELVNEKEFRNADGKRICSAVLVSTRVSIRASGGENKGEGSYLLEAAACALPGGNAFHFPAGVMVLSFPHGIPQGINSLADLLAQPQLTTNRMEVFSSIGGDFPTEANAKLTAATMTSGTSRPTVAQGLSQVLYDWIASAHGGVNLDSLISGLRRPFKDIRGVNNGGVFLVLDFDVKGDLNTQATTVLPFAYQSLQERQSFLLASKAFELGGIPWSMACYDQVAKKGRVLGGKHAGQALPGNPVNWCELPVYGGSLEAASLKGKGGRNLGLRLFGAPSAVGGSGAVALEKAQFQLENGKEVPLRRSYYSGGMTGFVELSMAMSED